jgi:lysophospholipase L1-like esterase
MKKRASPARKAASASRAHARRSFDTGATLAGEVLRRRAAARAMAAAKPRLGLLIAEGDSWFDYPFFDVLGCLEARGFEIESVAHKGDTLEDMAHEAAQVDKLTRAFEKVKARGGRPRAVLLSGGGNDIAGDEFPLLLNHSRSGLPRLNATVAQGIIDERLRTAMASLIGVVTRLCEAHFAERVGVVVHGYDYAIPDGRGYLGGGWILPGPWLEPGFRRKGYVPADKHRRVAALTTNAEVVRELIDLYNAMLARLVRDLAAEGHEHVRYVDLRGTLSAQMPAGYRADWNDELHPTRAGFDRVAERIAKAIDTRS